MLLAAAVGAVLAAGTGHSPGSATERRATDGPAPGSSLDSGRAAVRTALDRLTGAWQRQDRADFVAVAAGTRRGVRWAATTWRALAGLAVDRLDLRYVAGAVPGPAPDVAAAAVVEVTWIQAGWRLPVTTRMTVDIGFEGRVAGVLSTRPAAGSPPPVWALGADIRSGPQRALVVLPGAGAGRSPDRLAAMATRACAQVGAVLGRGRSGGAPLVVVVPADPATFARLVGGRARDYGGIAAVTTTVDGSVRAAAPVQVVLNPAVFGSLGASGAQIVLTHEATHAVSGAGSMSMPLWVAEGFADYVALRERAVPLRVVAGSALRSVRRDGSPRALPGDGAFALGAVGLDRAYEQAWLAFRMIDRRHGTAAAVAFHDAVLAGRGVDRALRATTGSDLGTVTAQWRAELTRLARAHA